MLTEQGVFNLGFFKQRYLMCENQEPDFNTSILFIQWH